MGVTTLQVSLGESHLARLGKWRVIENFPPEKSNDAFVRAMFLKGMEAAVPE